MTVTAGWYLALAAVIFGNWMPWANSISATSRPVSSSAPITA